MKNSILAILALAAVMSCEKKETTVVKSSEDSTMIVKNNSTMMDQNESATTTEMAKDMSAQDKMFADEAATGGMMEVK